MSDQTCAQAGSVDGVEAPDDALTTSAAKEFSAGRPRRSIGIMG